MTGRTYEVVVLLATLVAAVEAAGNRATPLYASPSATLDGLGGGEL